MVTVFLRGGLGNQMFQYAAGLALAKKRGDELRLDTVFLSDRFPRRYFTFRTFDLEDVFMIEPRLTPLSRLASAVRIPGFWLGIDLLEMNLGKGMGTVNIAYQNEREGFEGNIFPTAKNIVLYGRWESERYFADAKSDVRDAFQFRHALSGEAERIRTMVRSSNSVSVHIRRNDFLGKEREGGKAVNVGKIYYDSAFEHLASRVKDPHYFVFSDDVEWCKKNISLPSVVYLDSATAGPKASFHLALMSQCKHNVIANSTFSWWGAWLNQNPEKIVVAPRHWPQLSEKAGRDVVPRGWVGL